MLPGSRPGQRLGSVDVRKDWDAVLFVLLDEQFNATAIYEADRVPVIAALTAPGSKSRNERGAMASANLNPSGGSSGSESRYRQSASYSIKSRVVR